MQKFIHAFFIVGLSAVFSLHSFADTLFLQKLADSGVTLNSAQIALVESQSSIEDIVSALVGSSNDVAFIQKIVVTAVQAYPASASAIVTSATLQAPAAAGAIVSAAIGAGSLTQAAVIAIVKAAVTASPVQAESVRTAAIAAAPALASEIESAIADAISAEVPAETNQGPSPSA